MWNVVWEVGCLGCRMFGMRDVWDEGYLRCRVFVMQDIYRIVGRWFKNVICKLHLLSKNVSKSMIILSPLQPAYLNVFSREVPQSYPYKKEFCKYKANLHVKNATLLK